MVKTTNNCEIQWEEETRKAYYQKKDGVAKPLSPTTSVNCVKFKTEEYRFIDISYSNKIDWDKLQLEVLNSKIHFVILRCGCTYYGKCNSDNSITYNEEHFNRDFLNAIKAAKVEKPKDIEGKTSKGIKFFYRNQIDKTFYAKVKECAQRNIPFGMYYLSNAVNVVEAEIEAQMTVEIYNDVMAQTSVVMPLIFIDTEKSSSKCTGRTDPGNLDDYARATNVIAYCEKVKKELPSVNVGIYSYLDYFKNHLKYKDNTFTIFTDSSKKETCVKKNDFLIWVAVYGSGYGLKQSETWKSISTTLKDGVDMWQYTDVGNGAHLSKGEYGHDVLVSSNKANLDADVCLTNPHDFGWKNPFYMILYSILQSCEQNPNQAICKSIENLNSFEAMKATYAIMKLLEDNVSEKRD